ncbi:hypothetical protein CGCF415_v010730 [Colletotrichum fructicola]|uniref:Uncharacterized protein n=1 Tax=Colletotrichum fructicola (strain Nara gc5) TaxID=1213859 RepID=L2G100_COLFN|nr:uncharacterized protein CGMCC3_g3868 [Colletotrichum fructicola]KAF4478739.1 hypothetical protein CGGC5_v012022 [Colletotrichum fructicola Nara gc5]KAE9580108.1 hypothetical protein CGMCC3_g3868 [Colletotrichum fructicola]KAF4434103.1 hypothetical protein CFRS1_v010593 [Colletotrichum fructicola]KAF4889962.1 hypothetical protein CGCFRS4_v009044 [Colletotrichum fructicola]KAF4898685.1 hypothetical protein CGCF415_v010730 [Colletotrichum fructicola]
MTNEHGIDSAKSGNMPPGMAPMSDTRTQSIEDSMKRSKEFRDLFPDVDFGGGVIEPTVNLTFDLKEKVDEENRKRHEGLMAEMFEHVAEPAQAEHFFWKARECLEAYPEVLSQFDKIYLNGRPVSVMIGQLNEAFSLQKAKMAGSSKISQA